jgi:hypothetical protein
MDAKKECLVFISSQSVLLSFVSHFHPHSNLLFSFSYSHSHILFFGFSTLNNVSSTLTFGSNVDMEKILIKRI